MTLIGVMAVILRYFGEFAYLPGVLRKSSRSLSHLLMSSCILTVTIRQWTTCAQNLSGLVMYNFVCQFNRFNTTYAFSRLTSTDDHGSLRTPAAMQKHRVTTFVVSNG